MLMAEFLGNGMLVFVFFFIIDRKLLRLEAGGPTASPPHSSTVTAVCTRLPREAAVHHSTALHFGLVLPGRSLDIL